jgi:hypothetical protein
LGTSGSHPSTANSRPGGKLSLCSYANALGLPALAVPVMLSNDLLPVGVQLIARRGEERTLIAIAAQLEEALGGWLDPTHPDAKSCSYIGSTTTHAPMGYVVARRARRPRQTSSTPLPNRDGERFSTFWPGRAAGRPSLRCRSTLGLLREVGALTISEPASVGGAAPGRGRRP